LQQARSTTGKSREKIGQKRDGKQNQLIHKMAQRVDLKITNCKLQLCAPQVF
jgi:hypothetical protein